MTVYPKERFACGNRDKMRKSISQNRSPARSRGMSREHFILSREDTQPAPLCPAKSSRFRAAQLFTDQRPVCAPEEFHLRHSRLRTKRLQCTVYRACKPPIFRGVHRLHSILRCSEKKVALFGTAFILLQAFASYRAGVDQPRSRRASPLIASVMMQIATSDIPARLSVLPHPSSTHVPD